MDMDVDMDMFVTKTERDIWILSDSWLMNISTVPKLQICFIPCEMPFKTIPYNLLRQVSHILDSWKARHKQLKPVNCRHSSKRITTAEVLPSAHERPGGYSPHPLRSKARRPHPGRSFPGTDTKPQKKIPAKKTWIFVLRSPFLGSASKNISGIFSFMQEAGTLGSLLMNFSG